MAVEMKCGKCGTTVKTESLEEMKKLGCPVCKGKDSLKENNENKKQILKG